MNKNFDILETKLPLSINYYADIKDLISRSDYQDCNPMISNIEIDWRKIGDRCLCRCLVEADLIVPKSFWHNGDLISMASEAGYRQANALEAITMGKAYPLLQTQIPIVAFGDKILNYGNQPYLIVLDVKDEQRRLRLHHAYCSPGDNRALLVFPATDTYPSSIIKSKFIEESIIKH